MPSTIPYDPALTLGDLVSPQRLDILQQINAAQAPADAAQDMLNSLLAAKRSLDMTARELAGMGLDTRELDSASAALDKDLASAAEQLAGAKTAAREATRPLTAQMTGLNEHGQSPVDASRTGITRTPLSVDGLRMHAQYFSVDPHSGSADSHAASIAAFIDGQLGFLGKSLAADTAASVASQVQQHSLGGTLVISLTCLHKQAMQLAPLILDVEQGISAFNACFPENRIKTDAPGSLHELIRKADPFSDKALTLVSGATLGSCFIGLVHLLDRSDAQRDDTLHSIAASLQHQFTAGGFHGSAAGFGVPEAFAQDATALLTAQHIACQCSVTTLGATPALTLERTFADSHSALAAPGEGSANPVLAIDAMLAALDEHLQHCLVGNFGVPVTFYLQRISAAQLAEAWLARHHSGGDTREADEAPGAVEQGRHE